LCKLPRCSLYVLPKCICPLVTLSQTTHEARSVNPSVSVPLFLTHTSTGMWSDLPFYKASLCLFLTLFLSLPLVHERVNTHEM
jgi:hypothetical protein